MNPISKIMPQGLQAEQRLPSVLLLVMSKAKWRG